MKKKVTVAMSGGVDSSVAAVLLHQRGFAVEGVTMDLGIPRRSIQAIDDAKKVCETIGISHRVLDCKKLFEQRVIHHFVEEYRYGRTPNPCVQCNRLIKFGLLFDVARKEQCDLFATGHYADIVKDTHGVYHLKRPHDKARDQTYFLYALNPKVLPHVSFPLAAMTKQAVRALAREAGIPVADKEQSQDICFIPDKDYALFIRRHVPSVRSGKIVDREGKQRGTHKGLIYYTIGQRSGLGISARTPLYVVALDAERNEVVVGQKHELVAHGLIADNLNLLVDTVPEKVSAKIRYAHPQADCSCVVDRDVMTIRFDTAQEAVTPGQSVVVYDKDTVLGGGIIKEVVQ